MPLDQTAAAVDPLAVDQDVTVVHELLGREDGRRKAGAEHHRIQTLFEAAEQLFVGLAGTGLRLGVSDLELFLADRIVVLEFLLLHQQLAIGGELDAMPPTSSAPWNISGTTGHPTEATSN